MDSPRFLQARELRACFIQPDICVQGRISTINDHRVVGADQTSTTVSRLSLCERLAGLHHRSVLETRYGRDNLRLWRERTPSPVSNSRRSSSGGEETRRLAVARRKRPPRGWP